MNKILINFIDWFAIYLREGKAGNQNGQAQVLLENLRDDPARFKEMITHPENFKIINSACEDETGYEIPLSDLKDNIDEVIENLRGRLKKKFEEMSA